LLKEEVKQNDVSGKRDCVSTAASLFLQTASLLS